MMLLLANNVPPPITGGWLWGFLGVAGALGAILFCWNQGWKALDRFTGKSAVPQPMNVEVVKALHEQFASKQSFDDHVKHNTGRHAQIFNEVNRVEREARLSMEARFAALNVERTASLEKIDQHFLFIRENLAAINNELKHHHK